MSNNSTSKWRRALYISLLLLGLGSINSCQKHYDQGAELNGVEIKFNAVNSLAQTTSDSSAAESNRVQRAAELFVLGADSLWLTTSVTDSIEQSNPTSDSQNQTRATPTTNVYSQFNVFAYSYTGAWRETLSPNLMNNVTVSLNGSIWSPAGTYYWPGASNTIRFFAYAPIAVSGMSVSATEGTPFIDYTVPAAAVDQKDILAAVQTSPGNLNAALPIQFRHLLTAIKFRSTTNMANSTITKVSIKNVYATGRHALGTTVWSNLSNIQTFDQTLSTTISDATTFIDGTRTFMMLAQTLPANAQIEIVFTETSTAIQRTLTANIGNTVWAMGSTVTYNVSSTSLTYVPTLTVVGTEDYSYLGGTNSYSVLSKTTNSLGESYPVAWTTEFESTPGSNTWTSTTPGWLTVPIRWGNGGSTTEVLSATIAAQAGLTATGDYLVQNAPAVSNYNLSIRGGNGASPQNTANTYVVNAAGTYKFPVVYGNAIKNGAPNTDILSNIYVNHNNAAITTPYLVDMGVAPTTAGFMWQDGTTAIVSNIALSADKRYITFSVLPANIRQGNVLIGVVNAANQVLWSWHIWITFLDPYTQWVPIKNFDQTPYNIMPFNLGWNDLGTIYTYSKRTIRVRIKQTTGSLSTIFTITQNGQYTPSTTGNNTFYQWGRKDPMLPGTGTNNSNKQVFTTGAMTGHSGFRSNIGEVNHVTAILNPNVMYTNNATSQNWNIASHKSDWDVNSTYIMGNFTSMKGIKSPYDPSPIGYMIAPSKYLTGSTTTGNNTSNTSQYNIYGAYNNGYMIYNYWSGVAGYQSYGYSHFPSTGTRSQTTGNITNAGTQALLWSKDLQSSSSGSTSDFSQTNGIRPTLSAPTAMGLSVRPIREN